MVWPGGRIDVGGVPIANTLIIAGFLYWTLDCSNNTDAHTKKQSTQPVMGNTVVQPSLATAGCDDESVTEEEEGNITTMMNDNDWSKDDLNHHLRELILIHHHPAVGLSAPPRSVSIERTPLGLAPSGDVLWMTTTTVPSVGTATTDNPATAMMEGVARERTDEDNRSPSAVSSQNESPRGGQPPSSGSLREPLLLPSSSFTDGSMSTIPHVAADDEESVHFLVQDDAVTTTTTTTPTAGEGSTPRTSKDCCIAWYHCCCSRLVRALGLSFLVLLLSLLVSRSVRPESRTTTFQPKGRASSGFSSCGGLDRSSGRHIRGCTTTTGAGHVGVFLSEEDVVVL
jgi:hypothetical protein